MSRDGDHTPSEPLPPALPYHHSGPGTPYSRGGGGGGHPYASGRGGGGYPAGVSPIPLAGITPQFGESMTPGKFHMSGVLGLSMASAGTEPAGAAGGAAAADAPRL